MTTTSVRDGSLRAGPRIMQPVVAKGRIAAIMRRLARAIDGLEEPAVEKIAEEQQEDPFQVLIATMLSAQTRDPVTHAASTRLFKVARTPRTMARLTVPRIQRLIYPVSFYRHKAVHVKQTCEQILSRFGGRVPATMGELLTLPGVGRKTANLVLILAHRSDRNICVDTHVHRISNRLGWVATRTPDETEHALYNVAHRKWWPIINLYLVTWGQNTCRPVYPLCGRCVLADLCPKTGVTVVGNERVRAGVGPRAQESQKRRRPERGAGVPNAAAALGWPAGGKPAAGRPPSESEQGWGPASIEKR